MSGNIPVDATGQVVPGGAAEQTKQVCQNMMSVLKAVGTEVGRVVKVNVGSLKDVGIENSFLTLDRSFSLIWGTLGP